MDSRSSSPIEFIDIVLTTVDGEHSISLILHQPDSRLVPMARHTTSDEPPGSSIPDSILAYSLRPTLSLKLGAVIDSGSSGVVYDVEVDDDELKHSLPPLVVKIARPSRQRHLEREKFFYDYMQDSQGVILARCYGLYKAEATSSVAADLWAQDLRLSEQYENFEAQEYAQAHYDDPKDPTVHLVATPGPYTHVSVLLLEKLGGRLPLGVPLSSELIEDIESIGHDLEHHGVTIAEPRWCNILAAPSGPLSLPSIHSPHSKRVHNWRVIDLEAGRQSSLSYRKGGTASIWWTEVGIVLGQSAF